MSGKTEAVAPDGYAILPKGIRCRCLNLWRNGDDFYCCMVGKVSSRFADDDDRPREVFQPHPTLPIRG